MGPNGMRRGGKCGSSRPYIVDSQNGPSAQEAVSFQWIIGDRRQSTRDESKSRDSSLSISVNESTTTFRKRQFVPASFVDAREVGKLSSRAEGA